MAQTKIYKNGQWVETGGASSSATYVEYSNTESELSATNVQTAIDEVASEKVDKETGKGLFSGSYNDLTDKPTNVSAFANDAEYLTLGTLPIYNGGVE